MVWFKVDDKLHSHPKTSNCSLAAIGLWAVAGSWCSDHTTDGRVPEHMVRSLSRGAVELAEELVAAGLWMRYRGGYRFHQWSADGDGTKRNPTKQEVEKDRRKKAEAGRKGGLASGRTRSTTQARASPPASPLVEPPTRPVPSASSKHQGDARARERPSPTADSPAPEPPRTCPQHADDTDPPPCGKCADARKAHDRWEAQRNARIAVAPKCRRHRGQPAHNCALCRSEQLAPKEPDAPPVA